VRALQPAATAGQGRREAARARRRIHRRLAFAEWVFGITAASLPMLFFIALLLVLAAADGDATAAVVAGLLVGIWVATSGLIGLIVWWSYR
jgi:hypothetical protein